ncbi:MAG TPA: HYR domain-containing protein [Blastocatellia bacterium]|nr:HYR domain-containing protein [Blastocatellia bacterium]
MNQNKRSAVIKKIGLVMTGIAILALPDFFASAEPALVNPPKPSNRPPRTYAAYQAAACTGPQYTVASSTEAEIVTATDDIGNHGDNVTTEIDLPFSYELYDQTFTTAKASSNGVLQFVSNSVDGGNTCLPNSSFDYAIFAHWDDLCTTGDCSDGSIPIGEGVEYGIFTATFGEPGDRIFVIEWRAVYADLLVAAGGASGVAAQQAAGLANFEIRLYEGQKKFDIIYGTLTEEGCSATVGVQKDTGSCFTEYSCGIGCGQAQALSSLHGGSATAADAAVVLTSGLKVTFELPPLCTLTCPEVVEVMAAEGECGASVQFPLPTPSGTCDEVTCTDAEGSPINPGDFFLVGTTTVFCTSADAACSFDINVTEGTPPAIQCSRDITVQNDPGLCGATVNFEVSAVDNCGEPFVICNPPAGFFPVGVTTVECTAIDRSGNTAMCSFSLTVNDTQAPVIACPATVSANSLGAACAQVTFSPSVSDNCGANVVCNPPSGSCFPLGTTGVSCTATDAANNSASCSFTVRVFDVCLQDDSNPGIVFLGSTATGDYVFCCAGTVFSGKARVTQKGRIITFEDYGQDRRVLVKDDESVFKGIASLQNPPGVIKCTITDRDTRNNTCACP